MGVLTVVLGAALMPASAMAQTAADETGPAITITNPGANASYDQGQLVAASYSCVDPGGIRDCVGTVGQGANIDTASVGPKTFTVTSHDEAGNASTANVSYNVVEKVPGDVGGSTPATLTLTLGAPSPFAAFLPGVDKDYTTTMAARILTSSGDATLSVADPSSVQTGHLLNGTYGLTKALEIAAAKGGDAPPTVTSPVGGTAAPTTLLTYNAPVNDTATITFKQGIAATEGLRTGAYTKTLTFTLSTTQP